MDTPWYFDLLGIAPTEEERTIRRSYAIALKRIDQETEPEAFARLRQAYELAQQWHPQEDDEEEVEEHEKNADSTLNRPNSSGAPPIVVQPTDSTLRRAPQPLQLSLGEAGTRTASSEAASGSDTTPPVFVPISRGEPSVRMARRVQTASEQAAVPAASDAAQLDAIFEAFIQRLKAAPMEAAHVLADALNDEALISLEARAQFESLVANWLHDHPYPYGALLDAAVAQFRWREHLPEINSRKLTWLRRVMDEWLDWEQRNGEWREWALRVLKIASQHSMATLAPETFSGFQDQLISVQARYPTWIAFYLPPEQAAAWSEPIAKAPEQTFWQLYEAALGNIATSRPVWKRFYLAARLLALLPLAFLAYVLGKIATSRPVEKPLRLAAGFFAVLFLAFLAYVLAKPSQSYVAFEATPSLCTARAELGGHWAQLYGNKVTYFSFKREVEDCMDAGLWPGGKADADAYLTRLLKAHLNADDANNASMDGHEVDQAPDDRHAASRICSGESGIDPDVDPVGAGCIALAQTYKPERVPSFPASQEFCAERAQTGGNWHFDEPRPWRGYLSFKQEVTDCLAKDWWPGGQQAADDYLRRLRAAWTDKSRPPDAESRASTLTVGPGGRLVIGADGVQMTGNVRINGKPVEAVGMSSKVESTESQAASQASPTSTTQSDTDASRPHKPPVKPPTPRSEVPAPTTSSTSVSPTDCSNAYASLRHGSWSNFNRPETRPEREQRVFACVSASLWPGGTREPLAHLLSEIRGVSLTSSTRDSSPPLSRGMVTGAATIRTISEDFDRPVTSKMCDEIRTFAYQSDWRATGNSSATLRLERQIAQCVELEDRVGGHWFGGRADPISNLVREAREAATN